MHPIKFAINQILEKKCINCKDVSFCKLRYYYQNIENPTMIQYENLRKCIYYKKILKKREIYYDTGRI